jgi:hypothetical protein
LVGASIVRIRTRGSLLRGVVFWFADVEQSTAASLQPLTQNGTLVDVENGGEFTVP